MHAQLHTLIAAEQNYSYFLKRYFVKSQCEMLQQQKTVESI